jgi:ABC-type uncharacterized transport system auxiliary subunit
LKFNGPSTSGLMRSLAAVFLLGLYIFLAGCALRSRETISYHAFDYPPPAKEDDSPIRGTLMVYRFLPAPSVDIDSLVISQSSGTAESAQRHHWEDNPADMITELIVRDFETSGLFEKTVDQLSSVRYRYALEGTIRNLQGTTANGQGKALIEVEAVLTDFEARAGQDKSLLKKLYKIGIPTKDATPDSIIKGLDQAVREFSERLRNDIRVLLEPKISEPARQAPRKVPPPRTRHKKTAMINV